MVTLGSHVTLEAAEESVLRSKASGIMFMHVQKCQWNFRSWPVNYIHEVITISMIFIFKNDIHG